MRRKELKDVLKTLILEFHERELPKVIPRKTNIPTNSGKIISLVGVRRSGKTYLMFQTIQTLLTKLPKHHIVYLNFEDERIEIKAKDMQLILDAYQELYPKVSLSEVYFFFDEIQNVIGWEKFIRRIYDSYSQNIFITGSNSKLLSSEIATALRGRTLRYEVYPLTYEVYPLTFAEFTRFRNFKVEAKDFYSRKKLRILKQLFAEYLYFGGFPEVVLTEDTSLKLKILQEYTDVMIFRDLIERYQIHKTGILKYFIKRIIENIGKPLSIHKIFNELKSQGYKLSKDTLYRYLDYLEAIYLTLLVNKYSSSVLKSELSLKKSYVIDTGIINALTYSYKDNCGALLENTFTKEAIASGNKLYYFKENTKGPKCDFILIKEDRMIPIQVSYTISDKETLQREILGLTKAMQAVKTDRGLIITFEEEGIINQGKYKIEIMPAYKYFLIKH